MVMGQPTVILGSYKAARELLDGRGMVCRHIHVPSLLLMAIHAGTIYSDRPVAIMAGEL